MVGDTTNHSVLSFRAEHWLIARFLNSSKSVFKLRGLTFQNINCVVLRIVARCLRSVAIPDTSAFPRRRKNWRVSFWPKDSIFTCSPWQPLSSGGLGVLTPHWVPFLNSQQQNSCLAHSVVTGLLSPTSWVWGPHPGPSGTEAKGLSWQLVTKEMLLCLMPQEVILLSITIKSFIPEGSSFTLDCFAYSVRDAQI